MNETQKNIRAYKKALPELKERVIAVALLLLMSAAMMTSATFAWITLSRAPEVSNVSTTVAANGNLEIALATGEGTDAPGESKVGDSSAAEGQTIVNSNITWGNLINLSDPAYGLDELTLRPAQLNHTALLTSPLYSTSYGMDGRVEKLTSNFAYTSWIPPEGNVKGYFGLAEGLGVRAISSTKLEAVGFLADYLALRDTANSANATAGGQYKTITENDDYMAVLGKLMGIHMTANLNSEDQYTNAVISQEELGKFIAMYRDFIKCYEKEAEAIAGTLNLQLFLAYGGDTNKYTPYTASSVLQATANSGKDFVIAISTTDNNGNPVAKQVKITNFKAFIDDYKMLSQDVVKLQEIADNGDLRWTASGLKAIVNRMVNIDECTIAKKGEEPKTVKKLLAEFSSDIGAATGYMNANVDAVITNGVLKNFAQRAGVTIMVGPLPVEAKMYVSRLNYEAKATVKATVTTSAAEPSEFAVDLKYADSLNTGADDSTATVTAEDTYALAVDFWVRTNAANTYLTLEGNLLTKEEEKDATAVDPNGNTVPLYTLTRTETVEMENGETVTSTDDYDLYQKTVTTEDGTETTEWYNAENHSVFELAEGESPTLKKEIIITVIGYKGENRVWDAENDQFLSTDSTTQGSGSCYVYYADNPEDQERSLKLLESLNVAFIDSKGALLANACMDTKNFYAENGRVIVPLVLDNTAINLGEDFEGNTTLAITGLNQNEPMRITALVYLDGTKLTNQNVLAASDIQGQLNIQFGSSTKLEPIENEELYQEVRRVSASIPEGETKFYYDSHEGDMISHVTVTVDGDQPKTVTAFFIRAISASQGSREETMTFTETDGGQWTASHKFTAPGTYVLRTVQLDGVEYPLTEIPKVVIEGFTVERLSCEEATNNHVNVMTADPSTTINMELKFATNDISKMPSTVQGRFLNDEDGSAVNVNFKMNASGQWTGTATFRTSGNYTMQYLVLDGEHTALDAAFHHTVAVKLGMRVAVYTTSPVSFKFLPSEMTEKQKLLGMQVKIMDNAGNELPGLSGAKLTYRLDKAVATLDTDLKWDGEYYVGELRAEESGGPGTWVFSNVSVGGNNLTNATTSPAFRMVAPEPPSYAGITNKADYQFVPDGSGKMEANVKYSATATVVAIIEGPGGSHEVQGTLASTDANNVTTWNFQIPKVNNTQDGRWTIKELRIWNYYKANGDYVSAEIDDKGKLVPGGERDDPLVFDVTGENYTTKAVQTMTLRIGEDGNTDRNFSGAFLQTHTLSGVNFELYDYENQKLPNVTNVQMVYNYDGKTKDYGGYTSDSVVATDGYFTLNFAADNAGKNFVQNGSQTVQYAGNYTPAKLSLKVNGQNYEYTEENIMERFPAVNVVSTTPTVSITGRTNYTGSSTNGNTVTVVFGHSTESTCGITYHNYQHTSVTLGLADMGLASSATLNFAESSGATVQLYTEVDRNGKAQNRVDGYTWTADGDCLRWVGYLNQTTGNDDITPAGTITATKLTLVHNSVEYEVDIDDITIINKTP